MTEEQMSELSVSKDGVAIKSNNLNTIATCATFALVVVLCYAFWKHEVSAAEKEQSIVRAMESIAKGQQDANRIHSETNCLIGYEGPRERRAEFCKSVTR